VLCIPGLDKRQVYCLKIFPESENRNMLQRVAHAIGSDRGWAGNGDVTARNCFGVRGISSIINRRLSIELKSTHIQPDFTEIPRLETSVAAGANR
jgi:hypothetical protein